MTQQQKIEENITEEELFKERLLYNLYVVDIKCAFLILRLVVITFATGRCCFLRSSSCCWSLPSDGHGVRNSNNSNIAFLRCASGICLSTLSPPSPPLFLSSFGFLPACLCSTLELIRDFDRSGGWMGCGVDERCRQQSHFLWWQDPMWSSLKSMRWRWQGRSSPLQTSQYCLFLSLHTLHCWFCKNGLFIFPSFVPAVCVWRLCKP